MCICKIYKYKQKNMYVTYTYIKYMYATEKFYNNAQWDINVAFWMLE